MNNIIKSRKKANFSIVSSRNLKPRNKVNFSIVVNHLVIKVFKLILSQKWLSSSQNLIYRHIQIVSPKFKDNKGNFLRNILKILILNKPLLMSYTASLLLNFSQFWLKMIQRLLKSNASYEIQFIWVNNKANKKIAFLLNKISSNLKKMILAIYFRYLKMNLVFSKRICCKIKVWRFLRMTIGLKTLIPNFYLMMMTISIWTKGFEQRKNLLVV